MLSPTLRTIQNRVQNLLVTVVSFFQRASLDMFRFTDETSDNLHFWELGQHPIQVFTEISATSGSFVSVHPSIT